MSEFEPPRAPSRRDVFRFAATSAMTLAVSGNVFASEVEPSNASTAPLPSRLISGPLRSAGAMTFGDNNVLFVGDIAGAALHAFELRATDITPQGDIPSGNFHNFEGRDLIAGIDKELAAMLGTSPDNVVIRDMVVHSPSQQIFLSVERGRGRDAAPAIVKVNHGALEFLPLEKLAHSRISIPNEPDVAAQLEFEPQRIYAITDVKFYNSEVILTGISNQRFASTIYRIPYPFNKTMKVATAEIWHPVHGEFETRAPIIRHTVHELHGEPYLFAVYGCTPLVRFPLSALQNGAHVRGDVIGELGYGSNPVDLLIFKSPADQKDYLLVTIDTRSASQIAVTDLATAPAMPTGEPIDFGPGGLGKTQRNLPLRAEHTAILDDKWAIIAWRHPRTSYRLDLSTIALPYFFERKDGMSEMNWPGGPDPFQYKEHRND